MIFSSFLTQQKKRATSWQAENDCWRVRERRQHRKKVGKMSGVIFMYQGGMAKAPPCPERTLNTPMPQQSSLSSRDEESQWVAVEDRRKRRVTFEEMAKRMLGYLRKKQVFP